MGWKRYFTNNKRLYGVWQAMITRCENPNSKSYPNYGERGIKVCDEWHTFKPFLDWAMSNGYKPDAAYGKCTIDRIDVNDDYRPDNCRWVDKKIQARNSRKNNYVVINGEKMALSEAAERYGISINTVKMRIRRGWSADRAVTTPPRHKGRTRHDESSTNT